MRNLTPFPIKVNLLEVRPPNILGVNGIMGMDLRIGGLTNLRIGELKD
jgi:hypothetical protein